MQAAPTKQSERPNGFRSTIDEAAAIALAAKLAEGGATRIPAILQSLGVSPLETTQAAASIRALAALGAKDSVPALVKLSKSTESHEIAQECWKAVGQLAGPSSLPELMFVFDTPLDLPFTQLVVHVAAMKAISEIAQRENGPEQFVDLVEVQRHRAATQAKLRMIEILEKLDTSGSRRLVLAFMSDADAKVQRVALSAIHRADFPQVATMLKGFLASPDVALKKEGILVLGRCKSMAVMPALMELLDSKEAGIKPTAKWALQNITGRTFDSAAEAKQWWDAEKADGEERFRALADQVKAGPPLAPLAIEDLSKMVCMREKLEPVLSPCFSQTDFRVRASACDALTKGAPSLKVFGLLIERLRDASDVVRGTAWRALRQLSGQKLPNEYTAWNQWLQKRG